MPATGPCPLHPRAPVPAGVQLGRLLERLEDEGTSLMALEILSRVAVDVRPRLFRSRRDSRVP